MTVGVGSIQEIATFGWWKTTDTPSAPGAPTISAVNDGNGSSATITVDGDAGVDHNLYYRKTSASAWTAGETRTGDGDIQQTGLSADTRYEFVVVSDSSGVYGLPSAPAFVTVEDTSGSVSAAGGMTLPMDNLRTLLANSDTFQSWVSAEDATGAKDSIYLVGVDTPISSKRPFAAIRNLSSAEVEHAAHAGGARQHFEERGALELYFEGAVASANSSSHERAEWAFINQVGQIMSDMETLAGSGGYLVVTGWSVMVGPQRAHPDEEQSEGDYYQILLRVEWGI